MTDCASPDKTRYELYKILKTEVGRCRDWNTLLERLERQGVGVQFKHKGHTDEIQGIVFSMNGYRFNGSKVDRQFSYSKIDAALPVTTTENDRRNLNHWLIGKKLAQQQVAVASLSTAH